MISDQRGVSRFRRHSSVTGGPALQEGPVLLVANFLHPLDQFLVELFLYRDMRHGGGGGGAMSMFFVRCEPDDIARPDLLNWFTFALGPAEAAGNDQRLA